MNLTSGRIAHGAIMVFLGNMLSMGLGFAITVFSANSFGSSAEMDAFLIVAPLPLIAGQFALSISLIALSPYYQRLLASHGVAEARAAAHPFMLTLIAISVLGSIALALEAAPVARVLAPGFDTDRLERVTTFLRIAAIAVPFLVGMSVTQTIANAHGSFVRGAMSRACMNATAFVGLLSAAGAWGATGYFAGFSTAAALTFFWQYTETRALARASFSWANLRQTWRNVHAQLGWIAFIRTLAHSGEIYLLMIASLAGVGIVTIYGLSYRLAAIPLLLAASFALALFPAQAEAEARDNKARHDWLLWRGVSALTLLGVGFGAVFFALADHLTIFLYEHGRMTPETCDQIALTLRVLALGLFAISANNAIANHFWSSGRARTRIFWELIAIVILLVSAWLFTRWWGAAGLAGAYIAEFIFLYLVGVFTATTLALARRELWSAFKIISICGISAFVARLILISPQEFRQFQHWRQGALLFLEAAVLLIAMTGALWLARNELLLEIFRRVRAHRFRFFPKGDPPDNHPKSDQRNTPAHQGRL